MKIILKRLGSILLIILIFISVLKLADYVLTPIFKKQFGYTTTNIIRKQPVVQTIQKKIGDGFALGNIEYKIVSASNYTPSSIFQKRLLSILG